MKVTVEDAGPCRKVDARGAAGRVPSIGCRNGVRKVRADAGVPPGQGAGERGRTPLREGDRRRKPGIGSFRQFYREALEQEKQIDAGGHRGRQRRAASRTTQALTFRVTLDVAPEFKLPKYRKIAAEEQNRSRLTDEEVDEAIQAASATRYARFEDTADRPVQNGDLVQDRLQGAVRREAR